MTIKPQNKDFVPANELLQRWEDRHGPRSFAQFLRVERLSQQKTQASMARALDISRAMLCDIEKGRQTVSPKLALKIARKLGYSEIIAVQLALQDQLRRAKIKMQVRIVA